MQRTQIYLTDEQRRRIAQRAQDAHVSQAEAIRRILDRELGIDAGTAEAVAAIESSFGVIPDAPDWPEWLASVRGHGADPRLRDLGL